VDTVTVSEIKKNAFKTSCKELAASVLPNSFTTGQNEEDLWDAIVKDSVILSRDEDYR
jgi:hypothetical protein